MNRDIVLAKLQPHVSNLVERFEIRSLELFGSASRGALQPDSDIDMLVTFTGAATFDRYFGLKRSLEDILGREVDLATQSMIKPRLMSRIEAELLRVA